MKNKNLKEMYIVRYADDFRIFCRTREAAVKTMAAVTQWLEERLKLQISTEKTRVVNLKRQYSEFLGFKIKVRKKGDKYTVKSHICDKAGERITQKAIETIKLVAHPNGCDSDKDMIRKYNSQVIGWHNYYRIATHVSFDFKQINNRIRKVWKNRLRKRLKKLSSEPIKNDALKRYGKSEQVRYVSNYPIAPLGYIQTKPPMNKRRIVNKYTPDGREYIHKNLGVNSNLMLELMHQPSYGRSAEYMDNRISLFCAQYGKCAVTGIKFKNTDEIHCHHMLPRNAGCRDQYQNLTLVRADIHILIHAWKQETLDYYLSALTLTSKQLSKLNRLRESAGKMPIVISNTDENR